MREYFKIFGLPETASYQEVKDARIRLLKRFHPDLYAGNKDFAKLKTAEINHAFEELSNYFETKCEDIKNTFVSSEKEEINKKDGKDSIFEEKPYNIEGKEKKLKDLNAKKQRKEFNEKNGKKIIDIFIYILIAFFACLVFFMIFS